MVTIAFFGASTVEGFRDSRWGGFVARLADRLQAEGQRACLFNLGVAGETSREYVRRYATEIEARSVDRVVFLLGCNDVPRANDPTPDIRVPVEEYERNLRRLFAGFPDRPRTLITSFPVDEARTGVAPDVFFAYLVAARRAALAEGLDLLDVYDEWDGRPRPELLASDGLHMNAAGHQWLTDRVYDRLFSAPQRA